MKTKSPSTRQRIRRWVGGFRAAALAERRAAQQEGARVERAIDLALSMIEAARAAGVPPDPLREREVERVRETWRRLRKHGEQSWRPFASLRS